MKKNPCYNEQTKTHCTKRHPGCGATCPDWAEYVAERDAEYEQRRTQFLCGGKRISHKKARVYKSDGKT